jgi:hypothetical protein
MQQWFSMGTSKPAARGGRAAGKHDMGQSKTEDDSPPGIREMGIRIIFGRRDLPAKGVQ